MRSRGAVRASRPPRRVIRRYVGTVRDPAAAHPARLRFLPLPPPFVHQRLCQSRVHGGGVGGGRSSPRSAPCIPA
eukprot:3523961-Pleurochrysis_carterae.AAC.1